MSSSRAGTVRKIGTRAESATARKFLAEIIGTAFLTFIGAGAVTETNVLIAHGHAHLTEADLGIIGLSFAFALAISVYSIGKVSGCHVNPAITIALLATRRIEAWLAGVYIVAQFIGATIGALGIILVFGPAAAKVAGDMGVTSFASPTNAIQAAAIEAVGTFIFMFVITAMAADSRSPVGWAGLIIGIALGVVIMVIGPITGGSLNPARSFGPALIQTIFGGKVDWSQYWVYVAGPIVGAVAGAFAYDAVSEAKRLGAS